MPELTARNLGFITGGMELWVEAQR